MKDSNEWSIEDEGFAQGYEAFLAGAESKYFLQGEYIFKHRLNSCPTAVYDQEKVLGAAYIQGFLQGESDNRVD